MQRPIYVLAKHLADRGHTTTVLQPEGYEQRYPRWDNVQVLTLPCRYVPEARYAMPSLRREYQILEYLVQEQKYDLIHGQDYQNLAALPPIWIRHRFGIPITLVNNALVGISWHYGKWPFDQVAALYTHTLGRFILRAYDRLFFLYRELADQTEKFLGGKMPPWEVAPIGVDPAVFYHTDNSIQRKALSIANSEKVILFVGRLTAVKRIEWVLELTRRLLARNVPVRTIIMGGGRVLGNAATQSHLHQLAQSLCDRVVFTGPKGTDELREYYSIADVVVLPSRSEGLPNVLLEAGACRVPCVASNVGGITDIIQHGETGFVFPPPDMDAFVDYVEAILSDRTRAAHMGQCAYEWVTTRFNWDKIVDQYEHAFHELTG